MAKGEHEYDLLESQIQAINRFPDQNPNPVLRVSDDGHLTYANGASAAILDKLGIGVGDGIPPDIRAQLRPLGDEAVGRLELECGHQTYALLAVPVPEMAFTNIYGTDITALKAINKFPGQNPHPVLRIGRDGRLMYANAASQLIVEAIGVDIGTPLPPDLWQQIEERLGAPQRTPIEIIAGDRTFELLPVEVPEFAFINLYGTDVTAVREVARAREESERLLLNILPLAIADRLRAGERVIADRFDEATLLIADIVGFTQLSSRMSPDELVELLNDIFTVCDGLVERHGLEKVKTIGDAYMVVGGVPLAVADHSERVADFALDMATTLDAFQEGSERPVRFRIGVHRGPVIAGVIGSKRTIYDVWGETVNMASRMETLSEAGRIHVSDEMRTQLAPRFALESRGQIDVKGVGPRETWFLLGRR